MVCMSVCVCVCVCVCVRGVWCCCQALFFTRNVFVVDLSPQDLDASSVVVMVRMTAVGKFFFVVLKLRIKMTGTCTYVWWMSC